MLTWKQELEPFGMMIAGMLECLDTKSLKELKSLRAACDNVTQTNCWCYAYQAAEYLRPILDGMIPPREAREKRFEEKGE